MIGREQIPYLESREQLLAWADRIVRLLKAGDPNVDGAESTREQITSDQANYRLGPGFLFRFSTDASRTIHGFAGGTAARIIMVANVGAQPLVLPDQSVTAQPENRIATGMGASITLVAGQAVQLLYDGQSNRWRLVGATASGVSGPFAPITAPFIMGGSIPPGFVNALLLAVDPGELTLALGAPGTTAALGLATTAVVPGVYGDSSNVPVITVDAFGRLTAVTEAPIAPSGGTVAPPWVEEVPAGSLPGTVFSTSTAFTGIVVWLNGLRQFQVASASGINEFTYSGTTLTLGSTVLASDWLYVRGTLPSAFTLEVPSGTRPGTVFTTNQAYGLVHVWLNGVQQRQVGSSPGVGEFTYSGSILTMGLTVYATNRLILEGLLMDHVLAEEVPTGTRPGTAFSTSQPYVINNLTLNGYRQKRVGASPSVGEYTYSGTSIVTGLTIYASDWLSMEGTV